MFRDQKQMCSTCEAALKALKSRERISQMHAQHAAVQMERAKQAERKLAEALERINQLELGYDSLKATTGKWMQRAEQAERKAAENGEKNE